MFEIKTKVLIRSKIISTYKYLKMFCLQSDSLVEGVLVVDVDAILQNQNVLTSDDQEDLRAGDLEISSSTLINVADYAAERNDAVTVNQLDVGLMK